MLTVNEGILRNCSYFLPLPFQLFHPTRPSSLILSQKARDWDIWEPFTKAAVNPRSLCYHVFHTKFTLKVRLNNCLKPPQHFGPLLFSESKKTAIQLLEEGQCPHTSLYTHSNAVAWNWIISTNNDITNIVNADTWTQQFHTQTCLKCFNRIHLLLKLSFHSQNKTTKKTPNVKIT